MTPCPRCARPNAPHREACLYCGARMPNPTAPPAPTPKRPVPADLDALVRRAMTGGSTRELRHALEAAASEKAAASVSPEPVVGVSVEPAPKITPLEAPVAAEAPPPEPPSTAALLAALTTQAADAARAFAGDPGTFRGAATALRATLTALEARLPSDAPPWAGEAPVSPHSPAEAPAPPPELRLPTGHPYALAVVATGVDPALLARAAAIDLTTARAAVAAGGTRVLLRAADRADLDRRLTNLHAAGLRGVVFDAPTLRSYGPATAIVAVGDGVRVVSAPVWETPFDPSSLPRGEHAVLGEPWLLVTGEVEERRLPAEAESSRWQRTRYTSTTGTGGDARAAVVDLHTPVAIFRVREGSCDWRGLDGADPASQRRSLRAYTESLIAAFPDMHVEPRRVCAANARPGDTRATGWAAWEEHSRVCRLVWGR